MLVYLLENQYENVKISSQVSLPFIYPYHVYIFHAEHFIQPNHHQRVQHGRQMDGCPMVMRMILLNLRKFHHEYMCEYVCEPKLRNNGICIDTSSYIMFAHSPTIIIFILSQSPITNHQSPITNHQPHNTYIHLYHAKQPIHSLSITNHSIHTPTHIQIICRTFFPTNSPSKHPAWKADGWQGDAHEDDPTFSPTLTPSLSP